MAACDMSQQNFSSLSQNTLLSKLMAFWSNFRLPQQWRFISLLDVIVENVLLCLLHGSCDEGNLNLHLSAIRTMIPWCFAYDKVDYARYLSVYYAEMTNLPPCVYEAFKNAVQISSNNSVGRIPVDQITEVTVNKDT